mmetsp:Transcript_23391/g.37580  ORF Transcript_23391/g.37580 Transcript_23391/m.37580 type:complete len:142 (-) Transcript_23391:133-558(-)
MVMVTPFLISIACGMDTISLSRRGCTIFTVDKTTSSNSSRSRVFFIYGISVWLIAINQESIRQLRLFLIIVVVVQTHSGDERATAATALCHNRQYLAHTSLHCFKPSTTFTGAWNISEIVQYDEGWKNLQYQDLEDDDNQR